MATAVHEALIHDDDAVERWSDEGGGAPSAEVLETPERRTSSPAAGPSPGWGHYDCECGHALRVFGGGRHRVYFELADARLDDPVMNRGCPQCGCGLPGKNRPWATGGMAAR